MTDHDLLLEIHGHTKAMAERIEQHHRELYGNGRPGIVSTLAVLKWAVWLILLIGGPVLTGLCVKALGGP